MKHFCTLWWILLILASCNDATLRRVAIDKVQKFEFQGRFVNSNRDAVGDVDVVLLVKQDTTLRQVTVGRSESNGELKQSVEYRYATTQSEDGRDAASDPTFVLHFEKPGFKGVDLPLNGRIDVRGDTNVVNFEVTLLSE